MKTNSELTQIKVTVYITTYNRLELLKRAIDSVLAQTHKNIEIIVADDGSTDGSQEFLKQEEAKGTLIALCNEGESKGACYGRNRAIDLAQGAFITGLDDDDFFETWRIESFLAKWHELESESANFAGLFDVIVERTKSGDVFYYELGYATYKMLRKSNVVGNQIFTSIENIRSVNGFDELMPALQDWDTWIRLSRAKGNLINIQTASYVQIPDHGGMRISQKPKAKIRFAFERLQNKLAPLSFGEKAALTQTMYSYPQIDNRFSEILTIILGGYLRKFAQIINRTYFKKSS